MDQGRFWPRRPRRRRAVKIELSERGIFEPVEKEENVLDAVMTYLWRCGIPVFREQERVPTCWNCGAKVCKKSAAGHPDLHGYVPVRAMIRWAKDDAAKEWTKAYVKFPAAFYIEMKRPKGGRHRPAQEMFLLRTKDDGVLGFFARSLAEVRDAFATMGLFLPDPNSYTMEVTP
jgi:hypothetical protein